MARSWSLSMIDALFLLAVGACSRPEVNKPVSVAQPVEDVCAGSETKFQKYLFAPLDRRKHWFLDPDFDNEVFKNYLRGHPLNTDDNKISLQASGRYFECLSLQLQLSFRYPNSAIDTPYGMAEYFNTLKMGRDSIYRRVLLAYGAE